MGFGGWVPSLFLLEHLTPSASQASYAVAAFWSAIALGRCAAVPLSTLLPARRLLLGQMALLTLGALLFAITLPSHSLSAATVTGSVFGLGMSAVFPTMLSLPADLGYALDVQSTAHFLVASCLGEGLVPVAIGETMHRLGPAAFPACLLVGVVGMWLLMLGIFCGRRPSVQGERGRGCEMMNRGGKDGEGQDACLVARAG